MLEVIGVSKTFDNHTAVEGVSLALAEGEVLALLGPSGSGKSTLLSVVAGLEAPDAGDIRWAGESVRETPVHQRGFGLMFQDYALFPHLNVARNVGFGLRMQGRPRDEVGAMTHEALRLVGLAGFEGRSVTTLSGGEQQRVALARALAPRPRLLMLDEPLGALDRALRERLLEELRGILRGLKQTAIYVTHDQEEAFALADRVLILRAGRVMQAGTPAEVYARPASRFVAEFLGHKNVLPARLERRGGGVVAMTPAGEAAVGAPAEAVIPSQAHVIVRGEQVRMAGASEADWVGVLLAKSFRGSRNVARVKVGEAELTVEFPAVEQLPAVGEALGLRLGPEAVQVVAWDE
jgi:ABC-type Fe3+/spermidine/putrescine transport system ATPase subunit